jgi:CheY-like chemotaxis protein
MRCTCCGDGVPTCWSLTSRCRARTDTRSSARCALDRHDGGNTPAVAFTAYGRVQDRIRSLAAGYNMHVPKPVDPGELTTIVASVTRAEEAIDRATVNLRKVAHAGRPLMTTR